MPRSTIDNRKRQKDEVLVLSNIYNNNEFSHNKEDIIECYYNAFPLVSGDLLRLENIYEKDFDSFSSYFIKYLPPIRVYLQLNRDYPTGKSPNFYIISSWLSPWQISLICQKLDEIWLQNKGQEILFLWFEFLRSDVLNFLNIKNTLDISFIHMTYHNITDYFKLNLIFQNDIRAIYSILFSSPLKFLITYDKYEQKIEFESNHFLCIICFDEYCGKQCTKLKNCSHVYCKNCIQQYITMKIKENNVKDITCPNLSCNLDITRDEIKKFCPELFQKYENTLLHITLNTMRDVIFCPRISCQYPLIKNDDDTLAICSKCDYTFCTYCNKVYHGVEPCAMSLNSTLKLIEEYEKSNKDKKKLLQAKYGRKQLQIVVEKYLTTEYLKENSKACPNCSTMIEKIDGCNKMTCSYCKVCFCWLCGVHITTKNAYDHFLTVNNNCYQRLFDIIKEENVEL
ncbi:hypothetical protein K0M31_012083 [Melipona bicolor]|uniref:RBR-type E3 ubiquitin transferase n=1 Tax=Melipona bicolor TaxID=60889 RepID=A0AA40GBK0_9HYME|nr:hypothetical protein K0M31_012083 [Melipona bicolor]